MSQNVDLVEYEMVSNPGEIHGVCTHASFQEWSNKPAAKGKFRIKRHFKGEAPPPAETKADRRKRKAKAQKKENAQKKAQGTQREETKVSKPPPPPEALQVQSEEPKGAEADDAKND